MLFFQSLNHLNKGTHDNQSTKLSRIYYNNWLNINKEEQNMKNNSFSELFYINFYFF